MIGSGIFVFIQFVIFLFAGSLIYLVMDGVPIQKDREFTKILNSLRKGKISREGYDILMRRHIKNESLIYDEDTPIISPVNRVVKKNEEIEFNFSSTINFEFLNSYDVSVKLNNYQIDSFLKAKKLAVRGSYEASNSQLYISFYNY